MTQRLLATGLTSVGHEEPQLRMPENVLLREPIGQHNVGRLVGHCLRLPLPQDSLLEPSEDVEKCQADAVGHVRARQHGAERHLPRLKKYFSFNGDC